MAIHSSKTKKKKTDWTPIDPNDVFQVTDDRKILVGGQEITEVELDNLRAEVKAFKNFRLWALFDGTLRQKAIETGFILAENWEATQSGKMMIHNLGIMKSIMVAIIKTPPLHTPIAPPRPKKTQ